jgi:hypothetical protein
MMYSATAKEYIMLPIEKAKGQIWLDDQFLCDVEYDIGTPISVSGKLQVQRIVFTLLEEHCTALLKALGLTLVLADGQRHDIPRPFQRLGEGSLECYFESLSSV